MSEPIKAKPTFAEVMANKKNGRPTATTRVCLSPDIHQEFNELEIELEDALHREEALKASDKPSGRRLVAKAESPRIAQQIEDLIEANASSFYDVRLRALVPDEWVALRAANPPVAGNAADQQFNVHWDDFAPLAFAACLLDPEPTPEAVAYLRSSMSLGEAERLALLAWNLNEGAREVPKSQLATSILSGKSGA